MSQSKSSKETINHRQSFTSTMPVLQTIYFAFSFFFKVSSVNTAVRNALKQYAASPLYVVTVSLDTVNSRVLSMLFSVRQDVALICHDMCYLLPGSTLLIYIGVT